MYTTPSDSFYLDNKNAQNNQQYLLHAVRGMLLLVFTKMKHFLGDGNCGCIKLGVNCQDSSNWVANSPVDIIQMGNNWNECN